MTLVQRWGDVEIQLETRAIVGRHGVPLESPGSSESPSVGQPHPQEVRYDETRIM